MFPYHYVYRMLTRRLRFVGRQTDLFERSPVSISAGSLHNAVIDENGKVFTWGCNDEKALGRNDNEWIRYFLPSYFFSFF